MPRPTDWPPVKLARIEDPEGPDHLLVDHTRPDVEPSWPVETYVPVSQVDPLVEALRQIGDAAKAGDADALEWATWAHDLARDRLKAFDQPTEQGGDPPESRGTGVPSTARDVVARGGTECDSPAPAQLPHFDGGEEVGGTFSATPCPTCGRACKVVSGDEGTSCYEPVSAPAPASECDRCKRNLAAFLSAFKVWKDATEKRCRLLSRREATDSMLFPDRAFIEAVERLLRERMGDKP